MEHSPRKSSWKKILAAAGFLALLGGGAFLVLRQKESAPDFPQYSSGATDTDGYSVPSSTDDGADEAMIPTPNPPKSSAVKKTAKSPSIAKISPAIAAPSAPEAAAVPQEGATMVAAEASPIADSAPTSSACAFPNSPDSSRKIILNEIAWMGSPTSSAIDATDASKAEWIELKNISTGDVDLSGWGLSNISGKIKISFDADDHIAAGGFFLLSRNTSTSLPGDFPSQKIYSGDLANTGDVLSIMDAQCDVSDFLDASEGWPAGNNTTKQTLERNADGVGWHTSAAPGGTPGAENSISFLPEPSASSQNSSAPAVIATATSTPVAASTSAAEYQLGIAFEGDGSGSVAISPGNTVCTTDCMNTYSAGTQISLQPNAGSNSSFSGWTGVCAGQVICSFSLTSTTSLGATFEMLATASGGASSTASDTPPSASSSAPGHLLIAEIQLAGASSTNDFVKLYNPTSVAIDASGWKLHKRSQTGTDYSLKTFPAGSTIAEGQYFTWANSAGGFSEAIGANVSSTETLAADNSVAILDASGTMIDAVAWGNGAGQYGEGFSYPTSPAANQILMRNFLGGAMVDTGNNASDFAITQSP